MLHPGCIYRDKLDSPDPFYCDECLDEEIKFAINLKTVLSKMHSAYMLCFKVLSSTVNNSHLEWLKRHCHFLQNNGRVNEYPFGFGFGIYSQEAILTVTNNLQNVFTKKKSLYSVQRILNDKNIGDGRLKRMLKQNPETGQKYLESVLLKEALIHILMQLSPMSYQVADEKLKQTEGVCIKKCIIKGLKLRSEVKI